MNTFKYIIWCGSLAILPVAQAQVTTSPIAVRFQASPGTGLIYDTFSSPLLNSLGQAAFNASHVTVGRPTIYAGPPQALQIVAENGLTAAPGTGGGFFNIPGSPVQNNAGQVAFSSTIMLAPGLDPTNDTGIWAGLAGATGLVVREGQPAAGTEPGTSYEDFEFSLPYFNARGEVAFASFLVGININATNAFGIWLADTNSAHLIARAGGVAPGIVPTAYYESLDSSSGGGVPVNDGGNLVFHGTLAGFDVTNNEAIWIGNTNSVVLAVREGAAVTNLYFGGAGLSDTFGPPVINNDSQILFSSFLTGTNVNATNDTSLWLHDGNDNRLVAREGDLAPGLPGVFLGMFQDTQLFLPKWNGLAASGNVAFFNFFLAGAGVGTTNDEGLWAGPVGAVSLIAREGSHAPGTEANVTFGSFKNLAIEFPIACINAAGQVAFLGTLAGQGVGGTNNLGIWMSQPAGEPVLIARTGQQLDIGGGSLRTIRGLSFQSNHGGEDGEPECFAAKDQMAFFASFTDSTTGIFLASVAEGRPVITEISRLQSDMRVSFTTSVGRNYRLAYADALPTNAWTDLSNQIVGPGSIVSVTNFGVAILSQRFYRAVLLP